VIRFKNLAHDNVVARARGAFDATGDHPCVYGIVLPENLWRFPPYGSSTTRSRNPQKICGPEASSIRNNRKALPGNAGLFFSCSIQPAARPPVGCGNHIGVKFTLRSRRLIKVQGPQVPRQRRRRRDRMRHGQLARRPSPITSSDKSAPEARIVGSTSSMASRRGRGGDYSPICVPRDRDAPTARCREIARWLARAPIQTAPFHVPVFVLRSLANLCGRPQFSTIPTRSIVQSRSPAQSGACSVRIPKPALITQPDHQNRNRCNNIKKRRKPRAGGGPSARVASAKSYSGASCDVRCENIEPQQEACDMHATSMASP